MKEKKWGKSGYNKDALPITSYETTPTRQEAMPTTVSEHQTDSRYEEHTGGPDTSGGGGDGVAMVRITL